MQFVKVIRFGQYGFRCGSPLSNCREKRKNPIFLNRKIQNLYQTGQSIYTSEMILPLDGDGGWSGCFCYLEEYTQALAIPENRTIAFLPKGSDVWVRNRSHFDGGIPYYNRSVYPLVEEEAEGDNMIPDTWVQMSVEDALERKRLWKKQHGALPDWITECYLMEKQVNDLVYPSTTEKVMEFWLSKN